MIYSGNFDRFNDVHLNNCVLTEFAQHDFNIYIRYVCNLRILWSYCSIEETVRSSKTSVSIVLGYAVFEPHIYSHLLWQFIEQRSKVSPISIEITILTEFKELQLCKFQKWLNFVSKFTQLRKKPNEIYAIFKNL